MSKKCHYWKRIMLHYRYKPISYFVLFDTKKNVLYPFMSFSKYSEKIEGYCLSHVPLYICNLKKKKLYYDIK